MVIKYTLLIIYLALGFISCERREKNENQEVISLKDAPLEKEESKENTETIATTSNEIDQLALKVKQLLRSDNPYDALYPMISLFTAWNPVGKKMEELEVLIGPAINHKNGMYEYGLDEKNGEGFMFLFWVENGVIVKMEPDLSDFRKKPQ